jgi:hypothetical protein
MQTMISYSSHTMLELITYINSYFNRNNTIKLKVKRNQMMYYARKTTRIPGTVQGAGQYLVLIAKL